MIETPIFKLVHDDYRQATVLKSQGDLLIVDPPYNINIDDNDWDNDFDYEELFGVLKQLLAPHGTILLFNPPQHLILLSKLIEQFDFELQDLLIWQKPNIIPTYLRKKGYTTKGREYIFYITNKNASPYFKLPSFEKYHDGIYKYPRVTPNNRVHVCQKPTPLIEDLIMRHSQPNDLVIDLFLGSGVSAHASRKLKRQFIGYEKDKDTFNRIKVT
ncbi:DNA-methyltransferase [Enterococcus sp. LJL98]